MADFGDFPWVWERILEKSSFLSELRRRGAAPGAAGRCARGALAHSAQAPGAAGLGCAGAAGPLWQRAILGVFYARFEGFVRALFG